MPYLILAAVAAAMLLVVWRWFPAPVRVWTYLVTSGSISLGDLFVNAVFHLYKYKPRLLAGRSDNYLGVLLAELFFVPAYFTMLSVAPPRYRPWVNAGGVVPIVAIEVLFLYIDVYEHTGWQLWHTVVLFLVFGIAVAFGANGFERRGYTRLYRALAVGGSVYTLMNLWGLVLFGIMKCSSMRLDLTASAGVDLVYSSLLCHGVPMTLTALTTIWNKWIRAPLVAAAVSVPFMLWFRWLQHVGVMQTRWPWNVYLEGALVGLALLGLGQLDAWFARTAPPKRRPIPPWEPPI